MLYFELIRLHNLWILSRFLSLIKRLLSQALIFVKAALMPLTIYIMKNN